MAKPFCERKVNPRSSFDQASFRWILRGRARILVGCPVGSWKPRAKRCEVGLRAYKVYAPRKGKRCKVGERSILKP